MPVEGVGEPGGQHGHADARRGGGTDQVAFGHAQLGRRGVEGEAPDIAADARPRSPLRRQARVLERLPGDLEQQPLLRVQRGGLPRRHAEEAGVEPVDARAQETPLAHGHPAGGRGVGVVEGVRVPAVRWHITDGVGLGHEQVPEAARVGDAAGEPAADTDDRHWLQLWCRTRGVRILPNGHAGSARLIVDRRTHESPSSRVAQSSYTSPTITYARGHHFAESAAAHNVYRAVIGWRRPVRSRTLSGPSPSAPPEPRAAARVPPRLCRLPGGGRRLGRTTARLNGGGDGRTRRFGGTTRAPAERRGDRPLFRRGRRGLPRCLRDVLGCPPSRPAVPDTP